MQNFTKIVALVLIVASCTLALEASNTDSHALSQRGFTDVSQHYQDISKRAQERFKQLFLRDAPHILQMLKRASSEISKKTEANMEKLKKFVDSINVPAMITDIDKIEHFLEKLKVGLTKISQAINWLKSNQKTE